MATSRYDSSVKVKQEVIDRIKKMGMDSAVKAANSGSESAEFVEGAKRMYGTKVGAQNNANLAKRQNEAAANPLARRAPSIDGGTTSKPAVGGPKMSNATTTSSSVPMPSSAPAAASRKSKPTTGEKVLGKENARQVRKVTTPIANVSNNLAASRALNTDKVSKSLGDFYNKNIGHSLSNMFGGKKKRK